MTSDPPSLQTVDATRWSGGAAPFEVPATDEVVVEEPLEIRLGHGDRWEVVSVTMRTPGDDAALAAGFLFGEGILTDSALVDRVDPPEAEGDHVVTVWTRRPVALDPARRRQYFVNSSCGVCGRSLVKGLFAELGGPVQSDLTLPASTIVEFPARLRARQRLFDRSGGVHAAGLFDPDGSVTEVAEDVGRHNAVDKVVGRRFLDGALPARRSVLQISGRVSFEIVQKAASAGIPIVAAVSAPSSLAVTAADRWGITLAGFVRDGRLNVYAHPERLRAADPRSDSAR